MTNPQQQKRIEEFREKFSHLYAPDFSWEKLEERPYMLLVDIEAFLEETDKEAEARGREKEREQSHYNLAMAVQAIDFFIAKDGEDYGITPLHSKLHAYIAKEDWWKSTARLPRKEV